MNRTSRFAWMAASAVLLIPWMAWATPVWASEASQELRDAAHDIKDAGKSFGHATKHAAHNAAHAVKRGIHKAAHKVQRGAQRIEHQTPTQ